MGFFTTIIETLTSLSGAPAEDAVTAAGTDTPAENRADAALVAYATHTLSRLHAAQGCGVSLADLDRRAATPSACERDAMADDLMPNPGVEWPQLDDVDANYDFEDAVSALTSAAERAEFALRNPERTDAGDLDIIWQDIAEGYADSQRAMRALGDQASVLGRRILVVSYDRNGDAVRSHFRRVGQRGGTTRPTAGPERRGLRSFPITTFADTGEAMRFGSHATTPPPHMLTDVRIGLVRLNERTPDGRLILGDGFEVREPPLSFSALFTTQHGQPGEAIIVGSLDEVTVEEDGLVWGMGWLLDEPDARKAGRYLQAGALKGNSVELAGAKVAMRFLDDDSMEIDYLQSQLAATTIVGNPAMTDLLVELMEPDFDFGEVPEPITASFTDRAPAVFTSTLVAPPDAPPAEWFADPGLDKPTPVTERDGRVFGHVALWDSHHMGNGLRPPRTQTDYAYFATGEVETTTGRIPVGRLVIGGDHAKLDLGWKQALDYYAATSAAWAHVAIGEDRHGIWVAGIVRPGVDADTLHAARASGVSGDWRRIGGHLELVAVLSVNVPAFPVPRAFADNGLQMALTGIGINVPGETRGDAALNDVLEVVRQLQPTARSLEAERLTRTFAAERRREIDAIVKAL